MHDARHSPGFFPYPCFLLGQERRRWGGAAAEDGERGMRCGVAVRNARGAVLPGETQHGAWADAPRCDARCSALRWPMHRAVSSAPKYTLAARSGEMVTAEPFARPCRGRPPVPFDGDRGGLHGIDTPNACGFRVKVVNLLVARDKHSESK